MNTSKQCMLIGLCWMVGAWTGRGGEVIDLPLVGAKIEATSLWANPQAVQGQNIVFSDEIASLPGDPPRKLGHAIYMPMRLSRAGTVWVPQPSASVYSALSPGNTYWFQARMESFSRRFYVLVQRVEAESGPETESVEALPEVVEEEVLLVEAEASALEERVENSRLEVEQAEEAVAELESRRTSLAATIHEASVIQQAELTRGLTEIEAKAAADASEREGHRESAQAAAAESIRQAQEDMAQARQASEQSRARLAQNESALDLATKRIQDLTAELSELESQLSQKDAWRETLRLAQQKAEEESVLARESIETQLKEHSSMVVRQQEESEAAAKEARQLVRQEEEARSKREAAERRLAELEATKTAMEKALREAAEQRKSELRRINAEMAAKAAVEAKQRKQQLDAELAKQTEAIRAAREAAAQARQAAKESSARIAQENARRKGVDDRIGRVERELRELEARSTGAGGY